MIPPIDDKRRFIVRKLAYLNNRQQHDWHKWFAWRPVELSYTSNTVPRKVWLCYVYRRALYKTYATYDDWQQYEYADILGVLKLPPKPPHQRS